MRNSYLVRRIFTIVVLGVFLTVALTTITYTFLSQTIFTQLRENELTPKAKALGELVRMYIDEEIDQDTIRQIVAAGSEPDSNLLGAFCTSWDSLEGDFGIAPSNCNRAFFFT